MMTFENVYSATVTIELVIDGKRHSVAKLGPDRLYLREPCVVTASRGKIILQIDGRESTFIVNLYPTSRPATIHTYRKVLDEVSDALLLLHSFSSGKQLWVRSKLRIKKSCWWCGALLSPGAEVYRPITNAKNRGDRLCATCASPNGRAIMEQR